MANNQNNLNKFAEKLADLKKPELVLHLLFYILSETELEELGLRYKAYVLLKKELPLEEILKQFSERQDIVARVLMRK